MSKCTKKHPCTQCEDMDKEWNRLHPNPVCGLKEGCNLMNADCSIMCVRKLSEITEVR